MSDGNYNKNLLPYRDYRSGLRAGRAAAGTKAREALGKLLDEYAPQLTADERQAMITRFRELMR